MKKIRLAFLLAICSIGVAFSQVIPDSHAYLGQIPPGKIRKVFNLSVDPGYLAAERIAISPDGKEIYYEETNSSWTSFRFKYYKYQSGYSVPGPIYWVRVDDGNATLTYDVSSRLPVWLTFDPESQGKHFGYQYHRERSFFRYHHWPFNGNH